MSAYLSGIDREQQQLLPECLEDYIGEENPVRIIDAFVESLSEGKSESFSLPAERDMDENGGRKGYSPRTLAKLLIWGYLRRVRSTRALEDAARVNLEAIWLLQKLAPDHSSISRFRKANRKRITRWLKEFNLVCAQLDLFGGDEISVDGVFLKAVNAKRKNFTQKQLKKRLASLDQKIQEYLQTLEASEKRASQKDQSMPSGQLQQRLEQLEQAKQQAREMLEAAEKSPTGQLSLTDEASRLLKKKSVPGSASVAYLAESAVDSKHHLIAAADVPGQANDFGQLTPMAEAADEVLPPPPPGQARRVLADGGFFNINDLAKCEQAGYEPWVPAYPQRKPSAKAGLYPTAQFDYQAESDSYLCPQGQLLAPHASYRHGQSVFQTYYNTAACRNCPVRASCTKGAYRKIHRHENQHVVDRMRKRMEADPQCYRRRAATVEHPFGSMMFYNEGRHLLCRGLESAKAEFTLSALAYNIKRALKVVGVRRLMEAWGASRLHTAQIWASISCDGSYRAFSNSVCLSRPYWT